MVVRDFLRAESYMGSACGNGNAAQSSSVRAGVVKSAVMLPRRNPIDIDAVETRLVSAADAGLRGDVHCAVVQGIVVLQSVYARRTQPRKYPLRVDCGQRTYDLQ